MCSTSMEHCMVSKSPQNPHEQVGTPPSPRVRLLAQTALIVAFVGTVFMRAWPFAGVLLTAVLLLAGITPTTVRAYRSQLPRLQWPEKDGTDLDDSS